MSDTTTADPPREATEPSRSSNFYVIVFACVMLSGLLFLAWVGRPPRSSAIGEALPTLDLQPLLNVDQLVRNEDLLGKLAVLHFWGTWCPPCEREFPEFVELAGQFDGIDDVVFLSVSCSPGPEYDLVELKQKTIQFLAGYERKIPTYSDSAAMTRHKLALLMPNGSFGYPTTLLVGRDGKIIESLAGYLPGALEKLGEKINSDL